MTENPIRTPRLEGLDLARWVALLGMVVVNFKVVMGATEGGAVVTLLTKAFEGKAAATFVVLAGIGLGLASQRDLSRSAVVTVRRAGFLLAAGLLNMTVFEADILHYYALYFLLGVPFLARRDGALALAILGLNLLFFLLVVVLDYEAGWSWETLTYTDLWTVGGFARNLFFNGFHPVVPWLGFLLFGILLSRRDLNRRATQVRLAAGGAAALLLAELLRYLLEEPLAAVDPELAVLASTSPMPPLPLYTLAGLGAASAVTGMCLLSAGWLERTGALALLVPAGRQTLTLYVAHILVGMGTLDALGLLADPSGPDAQPRSLELALVCSLAFTGAATLASFAWSRRFRRGPLEAVMRGIAG